MRFGEIRRREKGPGEARIRIKRTQIVTSSTQGFCFLPFLEEGEGDEEEEEEEGTNTSCGVDRMEEQRRKPAKMERRERREMQQRREGEAKS